MNSKIRALFFICLGLLFGMSGMYVYKNFISDGPLASPQNAVVDYSKTDGPETSFQQPVDQLTEASTVITYVQQNHKLPEYYITKSEARKQGWNPSKGNLCKVLPGKAIGGDRFRNREGKLPANEDYFEADVNYHCGTRNTDRIIYTKTGTVYFTKDHYKSFEKQ